MTVYSRAELETLVRGLLARDGEAASYRALFDAIDDGLCIIEFEVDGNGRYVDYVHVEANPGYQRHTGIADIVGKRLSDVAPGEEAGWLDLYGNVLRTGRSIRFEREFVAAGRHIEVSAARVEPPTRRQVSVLFRDVTDRRHAEAERDRAAEALRALNETLEQRVAQRTAELMHAEEQLRQSQKMEAVGQLTGGVAHDFNNLLTVIRGSADLLRRPELPEARRARYIEAISSTAERAAKLTGQLLAFSRRQALQPKVFDAYRAIDAVQDMIAGLIGTGIDISVAHDGSGCFVDADPSQFDTAIVNMALNARDAMDGAGALRIAIRGADRIPAIRAHAETRGDYVAIAISDEGHGIAADNIDRIFEPFYTTKGVGHGTGLGLSQVFGFVKQSGGEVTVESTPGRGSTFTLFLPRVHAVADEPVVRIDRTRPDDERAIVRVLVVEDNADVARFAVATLAELGYSTVSAGNAAEALERLAEDGEGFDIVFSDVMMPGMSGIELARLLRARDPGLPIVLASGYSNILAAEGSSGFALLQKPYSVDQLEAAIREALGAAE